MSSSKHLLASLHPLVAALDRTLMRASRPFKAPLSEFSAYERWYFDRHMDEELAAAGINTSWGK